MPSILVNLAEKFFVEADKNRDSDTKTHAVHRFQPRQEEEK